MGLYNVVDLHINCPNCGLDIGEIQTKDSNCDLKIIDFREVDNFYGVCDYCQTWVEFN